MTKQNRSFIFQPQLKSGLLACSGSFFFSSFSLFFFFSTPLPPHPFSSTTSLNHTLQPLTMSTTVNFSVTAAINPPGAEPVLTRPQVWKALQRKVRHPSEFVPAIQSCEVVSEEGNVVTRVISIANGKSGMREVCTEHKPSRVEFIMEDGTKVQNILSTGISPDNNGTELFLTYAFEWKVPEGITDGTPQWAEMEANHTKVRKNGTPRRSHDCKECHLQPTHHPSLHQQPAHRRWQLDPCQTACRLSGAWSKMDVFDP